MDGFTVTYLNDLTSEKAIAISKFEYFFVIANNTISDTTSSSNSSVEGQPPRYCVNLHDCNHSRIMTAQEFIHPYKRVAGESYYLCHSCLREERGACGSITSYKLAATVDELKQHPRPRRDEDDATKK